MHLATLLRATLQMSVSRFGIDLIIAKNALTIPIHIPPWTWIWPISPRRLASPLSPITTIPTEIAPTLVLTTMCLIGQVDLTDLSH
jgi:hypothetical protein